MMKRSVRCLLPGLLVLGCLLLPGATTGDCVQRVSPPPQPNPQSPTAPASALPPPVKNAALPPGRTTADQLTDQEFRDRSFQKSHEYSPQEAIHDLHVGHFYLIQGDYAGALSRFEGAIRHDPQLSEAVFEAGQAELKMHQAEAARGFFLQYLKIDPQGKHAHNVHSLLKKLERQQKKG